MRAIMQGLTDAEFERLYGSEDLCLAAWVKVRRDAGMACPRCGNPKSYVYDRRVGCTRCDKRWSITSGTVMADTKLPLTIWFRAMHLMSSTKQCISAVELGRRLGVSYPTAWYLHKRLRHAMTQESDRCQLGAPIEGGWTPIVEPDDVYLGGERAAALPARPESLLPPSAIRVAAWALLPWRLSAASPTLRRKRSATRTSPPGLRCTPTAPRPSTSSARADAPMSPRSPAASVRSATAEGDIQGVLAQASARLPRCLLSDHQSPAQYARHDRRAMQRCRSPAYPAVCLRIAG